MNVLLSAALVVCWSSGFIGAKLGAGTAPVLTVLMWRFVPLALLLFAFAALRARGAWRGLTAREAAREIVIGALSQSGYVLAVYYAIQLGVSSGTTALIDGIQPLVAGALAGPLLREYVSGRQWAGLCLGVAGAGLVAVADAAGTTAPWWAYAVPVLGMLSLVAATVLEARSPTRVAPAVSMTLHTGTSAVLCTAAALVSGSAVPPADPDFWAATLWLAAVATLGAYGLYWLMLRRVGVTRVNTLMFLMAPVTVVWGALAFGEPLGPWTVAGLAVGLIAVAVVQYGAPPPRPAAVPRVGRGADARRGPVSRAGGERVPGAAQPRGRAADSR
ncbi:DMT family transporter [Streptomyces uncialis]|uniref:DMT family transporter n=1 Tax=Streptomyces uncialis TaxID=1048205 RepID=UPI003665CCED